MAISSVQQRKNDERTARRMCNTGEAARKVSEEQGVPMREAALLVMEAAKQRRLEDSDGISDGDT